MNRKDKSDVILWIIAAGFLFLIGLSWLTEIIHISKYLFGDWFSPSWDRAILRTIIILAIWLWVNWLTRRLLMRLHHLEEYLRICGWCRRVCHNGEWLPMERYFDSKFDTKTSHGMCPECLQKKKDELLAIK